jgi:hypothetical protein
VNIGINKNIGNVNDRSVQYGSPQKVHAIGRHWKHLARFRQNFRGEIVGGSHPQVLASYSRTMLQAAPQSSAALVTMASNAGATWVGDRLITLRTSVVAI